MTAFPSLRISAPTREGLGSHHSRPYNNKITEQPENAQCSWHPAGKGGDRANHTLKPGKTGKPRESQHRPPLCRTLWSRKPGGRGKQRCCKPLRNDMDSHGREKLLAPHACGESAIHRNPKTTATKGKDGRETQVPVNDGGYY